MAATLWQQYKYYYYYYITQIACMHTGRAIAPLICGGFSHQTPTITNV